MNTDLKYTAEHEWIAVDGDIITIGITAFAAEQLGDVVFVELPAVGSVLTPATIIGEIESTKSVGELYAPVAGEVIEINDAVVDTPDLVNADPFGEGWLIKVRFDGDLPEFLDAAAYEALTGASA